MARRSRRRTAPAAPLALTHEPQSRDATFDQITAKSLWIENDAGEMQASLSSYENGGGLTIYNPAGEMQASLATDEDGGMLVILNKAGERVGRQLS